MSNSTDDTLNSILEKHNQPRDLFDKLLRTERERVYQKKRIGVVDNLRQIIEQYPTKGNSK